MEIDWQTVDRWLVGEAWVGSRIDAHIAKLCREIGPRWSSSPEEKKAVEYVTEQMAANGLTDPDPAVRRRALEVLAGRDPASDAHREALVTLLADGDRSVVEVACWAAGEHPEWSNHTVGPLSVVAGTSKPADGHDDSLCREAAVAALGAVGHAGGRASVLAGLSDRPTVRRRAVLALASFEGDDVEAALRSALNDRDWQVRQAAEDLLGVEPEGSPTGDS